MAKNFYFGSMTNEEALETGGAFYFGGGFWHFHVESHLDEGFVRITDTLGRMIPVDKTHFLEMELALATAFDEQEAYDEIVEELLHLENTMMCAGFIQSPFGMVMVSDLE